MNTKSTHKDFTAVLADVASAVVGRFDMPTLLDQIIDLTMQTLNAEVCSIFVEDRDREPGVLKCIAGSGFAKKIVGIAKYKYGEGFTGSVAKYGGEFNLKSRSELENLEIAGKKVWLGNFDDIQWPSGQSEFRNLIALPLIIKGQTLGVIKAENKIRKFGDFSNEDLINLKTIANVISLTLENARLREKTEEQSRRIAAALTDIANAVVGHFDMSALLNEIINTIMKSFNAETCSIYLEDKEKEPGVLKCVAGSGLATKLVNIATYEVGEGITGAVAKYGVGYNSKSRVEQANLTIRGRKVWKGKFDHLQYPSGKSEFRNGIGLPLKSKDQILGVVKVENKIEKYGDFFTDEEEAIFKTIVNVIALAIQNTMLHQKTEAQSRSISEALANVAGAVVGHLHMEDLLDRIINITMETLNAEVCSIFLEDENENNDKKKGVLKCVAGSGFAKEIVGIAKYQYGQGLTGAVAKFGGEFNIKSRRELENLEIAGKRVWLGKFDDKQWPSGQSEFRNLIALRLEIKGKTLGVIKAENKRKDYGDCFSDDDLNIFRTIANVIALTIENTKLQMQIEDQLKNMSGMAGHRVNNQVTRYDGIVADLKRMIKSNKVFIPDIEKVIKELEFATESVKRMIQEFIDYGKPIKLVKVPSNINKIIQDEIWLSEPPANIKIIPNFDETIPLIEIDPGRFSETVKELLRNAVRIISESESKKDNSIYITTKFIYDENSQEEVVIIMIEDDGPGFPPNFPIFEPFHSTNPQRTGLGLATVKQNLEAHGGSIKLIDGEKKGASFELKLPVSGDNQ